MKILITGDVHAQFGILNNLINKEKPELVICCGDFGFWPKFIPMNIKLQSAKKSFIL
jgi:predicted phosphodiesterase